MFGGDRSFKLALKEEDEGFSKELKKDCEEVSSGDERAPVVNDVTSACLQCHPVAADRRLGLGCLVIHELCIYSSNCRNAIRAHDSGLIASDRCEFRTNMAEFRGSWVVCPCTDEKLFRFQQIFPGALYGELELWDVLTCFCDTLDRGSS